MLFRSISDVSVDSTKFSWSRATSNDIKKGTAYNSSEVEYRTSVYRPFMKQMLCYYKPLNEMRYQIPKLYPAIDLENLVIGVDAKNGGYPILTSFLPDLHFNGDTQCFPLYWYEENKVVERSLFDDETNSEKYLRRDGITDWILKEVRKRFGNAKTITKEHIFFYVYGILHSPQYRERFAADLKKSLPRIPIVDNVQDFMAFYKAGKALADLHLNYEQVPPSPDVEVRIADAVFVEPTPEEPFGYTQYDHYSVDKMTFPKVRNEAGKLVADKSCIIYNSNITIENIPVKAYEYVVNGKSAIEWIMERYAITQDSKSLIINDPNTWSREHNNPTYIYDLLLSVINLSVQTVDIVNSLPKLKL